MSEFTLAIATRIGDIDDIHWRWRGNDAVIGSSTKASLFKYAMAIGSDHWVGWDYIRQATAHFAFSLFVFLMLLRTIFIKVSLSEIFGLSIVDHYFFIFLLNQDQNLASKFKFIRLLSVELQISWLSVGLILINHVLRLHSPRIRTCNGIINDLDEVVISCETHNDLFLDDFLL